MPDALGDDRWAAIRALREGAVPTNERVALAAGVYLKSIAKRATAEGWRVLDFRHKRVCAAHREMIELAARAAAGEELDPVHLRFRALAADLGPDDEAADMGQGVSEALGELWDGASSPLEPLPDLPPLQRAERLRAMLAGRMEEMLRHAEAGRPLESRQVTALAALAQLAERIVSPPTPEEAARDRQVQSDEELAAILQRIDDQILYLAASFAAEVLVRTGMDQTEARASVYEMCGKPAQEVLDRKGYEF